MQTLAHNENIQRQFDLRSSTFDRSVHWVKDEGLLKAHSALAGKPGKSLELCCGTGAVSRELQSCGWNVTGLDISAGMIQEAKQHIPALVGDVAALPFADQSFDLAVMRQAYFLLDDGPAALREIKRILRPSGKFLLSHLVPFSSVDADYLRQVHTVKQAQMRKFYTTELLEQELLSHGFAVEKKTFAVVRESVSLWMEQAPELSAATQKKVCEMVLSAPADYKSLRNVKKENGHIMEDWNFVLILASPA